MKGRRSRLRSLLCAALVVAAASACNDQYRFDWDPDADVSLTLEAPAYTNESSAEITVYADPQPEVLNLFVDGVEVMSFESGPYVYDLPLVEERSYHIEARATRYGKQSVSSPVDVVADRTPPEMSLTSPTSYDNLYIGDEIVITASEVLQHELVEGNIQVRYEAGGQQLEVNQLDVTVADDDQSGQTSITLRVKQRFESEGVPFVPDALHVEVANQVRDLAGNTPVNGVVAEFDLPQWVWVKSSLNVDPAQPGSSPMLARDPGGKVYAGWVEDGRMRVGVLDDNQWSLSLTAVPVASVTQAALAVNQGTDRPVASVVSGGVATVFEWDNQWVNKPALVAGDSLQLDVGTDGVDTVAIQEAGQLDVTRWDADSGQWLDLLSGQPCDAQSTISLFARVGIVCVSGSTLDVDTYDPMTDEWSDLAPLDAGTAPVRLTSRLDDQDRPVLVWETGAGSVQARRWNGSSWTNIPGLPSGSEPALAVHGSVFVAALVAGGQVEVLRYDESLPAPAWQSLQMPADPAGQPQVVLDVNAQPVVLYRTSSGKIVLRRYNSL